MSTALAMLNSSLVNETVGLNELLLKNMDSYLRLSGLFEFNSRDGEGVKSKLTYASGLCLATIGSPQFDPYAENYDGGNLTESLACDLFASSYTSLNISGFEERTIELHRADLRIYTNKYLSKYALLKLEDLVEFLNKANIPITSKTFISFFVNAEPYYLCFWLLEANEVEKKLADHIFYEMVNDIFGSNYSEDIDKALPVAAQEIVESYELEENELQSKKSKLSDIDAEEMNITDLNGTKRALILAVIKLTSTSTRLRKSDGKPNISTIVDSLLEQFKDGKGPRGFGNTTITNSINATMEEFYKDIKKLM